MNEKAHEAMAAQRDEPETALEYLKRVDDSLKKLVEGSGMGQVECMAGREVKGERVKIDPSYKTTLYYNIATCYHKLGMLEECVDYLELATRFLNEKIAMIEEEENALLFQATIDNEE
jgi:tetratricopeptide (TPR) repeat protein